MTEIEAFIRAYAAEIGMDPDIAVRAAKSEGGLTDPFQQSFATKNGIREPSYGPFQLLIGGPGTGFGEGVGNRALAAGIDPRKDWQAATRFGMDYANQRGWGEWYGPRKAGIGRYDGIAGRPQPKQYGLTEPEQVGPNTRRPYGPLEAAGGGSRPDRFTASPGGPVEAAGGGAGNDGPLGLERSPVTTPGGAVATPDPAREEERQDWWDKHFNPSGGASTLAGLGGGAQTPSAGKSAYPGAARVDAPDVSDYYVQMAALQRQALAEAMAKLNSGRLFG